MNIGLLFLPEAEKVSRVLILLRNGLSNDRGSVGVVAPSQ